MIDLFETARQASILAVAERLGLEVYRGNLTHCPDHKNGDGIDQHASCGLNPRTNRFRCFSCGNRGSTVDLTSQVLDVSAKEAAEWIAGENYVHPPVPTAPSVSGDRQAAILEDLLAFASDPSQKALTYLARRGIRPEVIKRCRITDVQDYAGLQRHLVENHRRQDLVLSGVLSAKGNLRFYRHPLLFPFLLDARIAHVQGRRFSDEKPKYLAVNGPIPCLFNRDSLEEAGEIWLAEGIMDTLTLLSEGKLAVGIVGAFGFKPAWASLFRGRDVILALDADDAGRSGAGHIRQLLEQADATVRFASLPAGQDINSFYCSTGLLPEIC